MSVTQSTLISVVLGAGLLASSAAMAVTDAEAFQATKAQRIANLQERLQIIQTHLSCAQAAQDAAALKTCHETAKQQGDALEAKMKAQADERKAQQGAQKTAP